MRLYLDDDTVMALLVRLLQRAGHDVARPADLGLSGEKDPVHLRHSIHESRILVSHNHDDFEALHLLMMEGLGHHPGILVVRKQNDSAKDMRPRHIVRAIANLEAASVPIDDQFIILNQWR
jgi:predicted nuclease of predicted toxin-antitoxin system